MTRLIDADALRAWFSNHSVYDEFPVGYIMGLLDDQPTVDAEPVRHAKWLDEGYYADNTNVKAWHCSECNWHMLGYSDELFRYCPMCGTRMDKDETD